MRAPLLGSVVVHVAILVALLVVHGPTPLIIPGPDVVQVALIEPTSTPVVVAARPAPPPPRVEPAEVKAEPGEGVKLAPPARRAPRPEPEKPRQPESLLQSAALPSAPVGNSGLRGGIAVDARDFEFTYYLMLVRNRVAQNWSPPAGLSGAGSVQAVVAFRIGRGGEISSVRLESGSAMEFFDRSAVRAVMLSDPLPPLPLGYAGGSLGVHFGFQYAAP